MRSIIGDQYKLVMNLAHKLDYPSAMDLVESATWKSALKSKDQMFGPRKIKDYIKRQRFELYDLKSDPYESKNLADNPEYTEILEKLKKELRNWQMETEDPWVVKWSYE